jgi:hypothetical protein
LERQVHGCDAREGLAAHRHVLMFGVMDKEITTAQMWSGAIALGGATFLLLALAGWGARR